MKYLSKREDFLRTTRTNESTDFLRSAKSGLQPYELIKEDGGPFYNTVGWNDSLLGRLINHLIRKAKVALGKVRIKPVVSRLYAEFDRIVAEGVLLKADDETKKIVKNVELDRKIADLKKSIDDGDDYKSILGLTDATIECLNNLDIEEKNQLLLELEGLKKFLEQFKENESEEEPNEESEEEISSNIDALYPLMVENLKSLSLLIKTNSGSENTSNTGAKTTNINVNTNARKEMTHVESFIFESNVDPKKEIEDLKSALEQAKKNPKANKDQIDMLTISIQNKEKQLGNKGSIPNQATPPTNSNIKQLIDKLRESVEILVNPKIKIAVDTELIDTIIAQGDIYKEEIIKLYTEINSFLFGAKAKTLNYEPDKLNELYKGAGKNLIGNNVDAIAEKIAKFYKRAIQFEEANLYDKIGEFGTSLKSFVDTMKKVNSGIKPTTKVIEKPTEVKPENASKLLPYNRFIKINEEVETEEVNNDITNSNPSEVATGSISEKVKDFFERKCKTTKNYTMDKTEVEKVTANIEKLKNNTDNFIIDGLDPILNIVRLFNRAYKIYTVTSISKRKDGPTPGTLSEYTSFGEKGPYRNNKIFNIWEDAVLKIMGDARYQYIFSKTTKLRMPLVSNPSKKEDYEYRDNAGANLRKFMTDILDGDALYKISGHGSEKGAQAKFLAKYFGEPDEKTKVYMDKGEGFTLDREDGEENSKNASAIEASSIPLKFKKSANKTTKQNQFFTLSYKTIDDKGVEGDVLKYRYFYIAEKSKSGNSYLAMCNTFYYFQKYVIDAPNGEAKPDQPIDGRKKIINKGDLSKLNISSNFTKDKKFFSYLMHYTSIKNELLDSISTPGINIEITSIGSDNKAQSEKIKIIDSYWLVDDKSIPYTPNITQEYLDKKITGGSNSIKKIATHIKNANNTSIKKI